MNTKKVLSEEEQEKREELKRIFARNLKVRRTELGMTQDLLSEKTGFSKNTVCIWETGKRLPPDGSLKRLAEVLQTTPDWLLGRTKYVEGDGIYLQNRERGPRLSYLQIVSPETGRCEVDINEEGYARRPQWEFNGKYPVMEKYLRDYTTALDNGKLYVMEVEGDGLAPFINASDYVIFSFGATVGNGEVGVVQYGGSLRVRRLVFNTEGSSSNTITLEVTNKDFETVVIDMNTIDKKKKSNFAIFGKVIYVFPHPKKPQSKWG